MAFENFPSVSGQEAQSVAPKGNNWRNLLTGGLLVSLLGTWGYIIYDKNQNKETIQKKETLVASLNTEKDQLRKDLEDATERYDMMKTDNARKDSTITAQDREIADKKSRIQGLLAKVNASKEELSEARRLINSLNGDIDSYRLRVEKLEGEKVQLTQEKVIVTEQRDRVQRDYDSAKTVIAQKEDDIKQKESVIDVGSTLRASNFAIAGVKERRNGKEVTTDKAKKVDKLRITFDLDENRIAQTGNKDIYICITDPTGNPVAIEAAGSGKFTTREEGEKIYTKKLDVIYTQGQRQTVNFDWKQESKFGRGEYKIEVYHNGFKIGAGTRSLRKGFLG